MSVEYQAAHITPPLKNSAGMVCIANIVCSTAGISQDLSALFGQIGGGTFYTIQADGAKVYIAFGVVSGGSIDAFATGVGATVCYPLQDGQQLSYMPLGGREQSTGWATMVRYTQLYAKVASGGVSTAYLRLYRSSTPPLQGSEAFPPA